MRLSKVTTLSKETKYFLDNYQESWPDLEPFAKYLWYMFDLPLTKDGEYWIEIKIADK